MQHGLGKHQPQVDPTAFVHPRAVLIGQVTIGARSSVWPCATLRGDDGAIIIGEASSIQDGAVVHMTEGLSRTVVGHRVTVGHNAILHGCTVGDECIIGMGAILLDNAIIEPCSIVAAGSLIPAGKRVPAGTVVMGNPFRVVRTCTAKDREFIDCSWRTYVAQGAKYAAELATFAAVTPMG